MKLFVSPARPSCVALGGCAGRRRACSLRLPLDLRWREADSRRIELDWYAQKSASEAPTAVRTFFWISGGSGCSTSGFGPTSNCEPGQPRTR